MKRTFLLTLDLPPELNANAITEEIRGAVEDSGFLVIDVKPWSAHDEITSPLSPPPQIPL